MIPFTAVRAAVPALALAVSAAVAAPGEPSELRFFGYARDLASGRYLYTEVHEARVEGQRWLGGTVTYVDAAGELLGRKTLDFRSHPFVPEYRTELVQEGYVESLAPVAGGLELTRRLRKDRPEEVETIALREPMVADAGLHLYVRSVFEELLAGATREFRIVVPGSLDAFRFRVAKAGDTTFEGRPAVLVRMEPATLLRILAEPLELVYLPERRKLVEYRGLSNVHDPATGQAYNVRITYPSKRPSDAPALPPGY